MTGRERVQKAKHFKMPDKVPVEFYYCPVGYYEHGEKLNELYATLPGDFSPFQRMPVPVLPRSDFDEEGNYHVFRRDDWGVLWEYRIFGIAGMPVEFPLRDISRLDGYVFPPVPRLAGPDFDRQCMKVNEHQQQYYYSQHVGSLFELLIQLCPEENALVDMELDEPGINKLADRLVEHAIANVNLAVAEKADGISFGDDYGTEKGLIMSPRTWRRFIKPRLREIFAPAVKANLDIHFHSCGQISDILEDLREIGVNSIWPQIPAYDMPALAHRCRSLGLGIAVHTDRARTMTYGKPQDVRDLVRREFDVFRMADGGSWFYIEADNGFPFENIEALVNTIRELRCN